MIIDIQSNKCNQDTKKVNFLKLIYSFQSKTLLNSELLTVVMSHVKSRDFIFQVESRTVSLLTLKNSSIKVVQYIYCNVKQSNTVQFICPKTLINESGKLF